MDGKMNFLVSTADRSYLPLDALPGVGIKPMNTLDKPRVWSAIVRVDARGELPKRQHTALCEMLVIGGTGKYATTGEGFSEGDYLREMAGV